MLCYRCGSHVPDGSEACGACGQKFSSGNLRQATGTFSRRKLAGVQVDGAPFKPGDLLENRYLIRDIVGAGPLGYVFKAQDKEIDVEVALKAISPKLLQSHEERKTFAREVRLARKLSHNNLVRVYEDGEADDRPFYTMQCLDGLTLRRIIDLRREKNQFFALKEVEPIFGQVAAGLDNAHKLGPHSNLKPENVIVLPDLLKLTDFGLGLAIPRLPFAAAQRAKGGHRYLAPEYTAGHEIDGRADVYSLGVIFGEMVAGAFPDAGAIPELRKKNPELPVEVESIYGRAVNENPTARFATPGELFAALSELTAKLASASPGTPARPTSPRAERPPAAARRPSPPPPPVELPKPSPTRRSPPAPPVPEARREPAFASPAAGVATSTELPPVASVRERPRREARPKQKSGTGRLLSLALIGIVAGGGGGYALLSYLNHPAVIEGTPPGPKPVVTPHVPVDAGSLPVQDAGTAAAAIADAGVQAAQPPSDRADKVNEQDETKRRAEELRKAEEERKLAEARAEEERKRKQAREKAQATEVSRKPTCPGGMRLVPAGSFKMGAARNDPMMGFDEKPLANVQVDAYCIDYFEYPNRRGAMPQTNVTFQAAEKACKAHGKRLCTEEEWERACKGSAGLRFPYGANFDAEACNTEDASGEDRPVAASGTFSRCRSGYGIADMSGNVAEWTSSKYNADLEDRTLKGGASDRPDYATRCASRKNGAPGTRSDRIGFRCCAAPK